MDSEVHSNASADFLSKNVRFSEEFSPRNVEMLQAGAGDDPVGRITISTQGGRQSNNLDNMKSQKYLLEDSNLPAELAMGGKKNTTPY